MLNLQFIGPRKTGYGLGFNNVELAIYWASEDGLRAWLQQRLVELAIYWASEDGLRAWLQHCKWGREVRTQRAMPQKWCQHVHWWRLQYLGLPLSGVSSYSKAMFAFQSSLDV